MNELEVRGSIVLSDSAGNRNAYIYAGELLLGGQKFNGRIRLDDNAGEIRTTIIGDLYPDKPETFSIIRMGGRGYYGNAGRGSTGCVELYNKKGARAVSIYPDELGINLNDKLKIIGDLYPDKPETFSIIRMGGKADGRWFTGAIEIEGKDEKGVWIYPDQIRLFKGGKDTIKLDGNSGDILLSGADCAEEFAVTNEEKIDSGTVLVFNDNGVLQPCEKSYDKRVAGVVSGANGVNPGIVLNKNESHSGALPIALLGKVYCKTDADYDSIELGDLLTTSPTIGHSMKANDREKSFGAVIGKAMQSLDEGRGLIPILVALQ
jgi:hypothetical protein